MSRQSLNECRPSQVRFRVERPCTRCTTILVDQDTGEVDSRNWLTRVLAKAAGRYGAADPRYLPGATLPPRPRPSSGCRKVFETAAQRQETRFSALAFVLRGAHCQAKTRLACASGYTSRRWTMASSHWTMPWS